MTDTELAILILERDALKAERDTLKAQVEELLTILDQVTSLLARKKKSTGITHLTEN